MKITVEEILDMVWNNGLEFTILEGINFEDIEDSNLKKLFEQAHTALKEISNVLDTYSIEDDENYDRENYPEQLYFNIFDNLNDDEE